MSQGAKFLIGVGLGLVIVGLIWGLGGKSLMLGNFRATFQ